MPVFMRYFGIQRSGTDLYGAEFPEHCNMETSRNSNKNHYTAYIRISDVVVGIFEQSI